MADGVTYGARTLHAASANVCSYPGCDVAPADDSNYCAGHRDDARARSRASRRRIRKRWEAEKLCLRCGRKRAPHRRHCAVCLVALGRTPHPGVNNYVNKTSRVAAGTKVDQTVGNEGRRRFHGSQGRRGPPGKEREDANDFADLIRSIERAREGVAYAYSPEVQQLPRAQRQEVLHAALAHADHGARFIASILERHNYRSNSDPSARKDED